MSEVRLRRLLVTGGAGFIGSAFIRQRLRVDPEIAITVLDKLTYAASRGKAWRNSREIRGCGLSRVTFAIRSWSRSSPATPMRS